MFGPVSGAHFNPVVSFVDAAFGGLRWRVRSGLSAGAGGRLHGRGDTGEPDVRPGCGEHLREAPGDTRPFPVRDHRYPRVDPRDLRAGPVRPKPVRPGGRRRIYRGRRTSSRPQPASPTRRSPWAGCSRTPSRGSPHPRCLRSSPPRSSGGALAVMVIRGAVSPPDPGGGFRHHRSPPLQPGRGGAGPRRLRRRYVAGRPAARTRRGSLSNRPGGIQSCTWS